ncbi:MAG: type II toxin-antitoxin system RelE/ParE family toxin [Nevskiales bacterium]
MIRVVFSAEFKSALHRLSKKYRHIRSDIQPILDQLAAGETPGDQVPGIGATVYKVRAANQDAQVGKSGGYRVIYYLQTDALRVLLTIYSKSQRTDITIGELKNILADLPR